MFYRTRHGEANTGRRSLQDQQLQQERNFFDGKKFRRLSLRNQLRRQRNDCRSEGDDHAMVQYDEQHRSTSKPRLEIHVRNPG